MNPLVKKNRSGFEEFIKTKLPIGSNYATYVRSFDRKIKSFYNDKLDAPFESVFATTNENEIFKIKQEISSHPSMVYIRRRSGDSRIEGLDWYIEFLRMQSTIPDGTSLTLNNKRLIRKSTADMEGKHIKREHISIQRNPEARRKCIEYYGCKCAACGVNMGVRYGEIGMGFIEVHHRCPIHLFDDSHTVDFIEDLIPLCPNCHAMIHKLENPGDLDLLRSLINNQ